MFYGEEFNMYFKEYLKKYDNNRVKLFVDMDGVIADYEFGNASDFDKKRPLYERIQKIEEIAEKENIELFSHDVTLGETEMTALYRAANQIRRIETIPCTECRYCTDGCPEEIKIPDIFRLYNKYLENKDMGAFMQEYKELCPEKNRADNCLACGVCMEKCPQNIPIPDILAQMPKIKQ